MREREDHQSKGLGSLPVQTEIEVPGLLPGVFDKDNNCVIPDNLKDKLPQLEREIAGKPWFLRLLNEVHLGEKKGIFAISPGRIIITVAAAALGVEFGIRGGRDLQELRDSVRHLFEKENPSGPKK